MGVQKYVSASSSNLKWTALATALQNVPTGASTLIVLNKRILNATADAAAFDGQCYLLSGSGAGTVQAGFSLAGAPNQDKVIEDFASSPVSTTAFTGKTSPNLLCLSKASGTATPRLGWQIGSGGTMTHENLSGSQTTGIAAAMLQIGSWQDTDFGDNYFGLVAWFAGVMSDTDKAAIGTSWSTGAVWNNALGTPLFCAELNVAGGSTVDMAGNATSLTATGITLDAGETLDSWNFNGTGGPPPAIMQQYTSAMNSMQPTGKYL